MIPILVSVLRAVKKGMEKATHHEHKKDTTKVTPYHHDKNNNKTDHKHK